MITGYTCKLVEEGQSFNDFVLNCVKAFFIQFRDTPSSDEIPISFEPSTYHREQWTNAVNEFRRLELFTESEKLFYGEQEYWLAVNGCNKSIAKSKIEQKRIDDMKEKVMVWEVPKPYQPIKDFMLNQLELSKSSSTYAEDRLKDLSNKPLISYFDESLAMAKENVEYHKNKYAEEVKAARQDTEFIQGLRKLLEPVELIK